MTNTVKRFFADHPYVGIAALCIICFVGGFFTRGLFVGTPTPIDEDADDAPVYADDIREVSDSTLRINNIAGVYNGSVLNSKPEGYGEWVSEKGNKYIGSWHRGRLIEGKLIVSSDEKEYTYEGQFDEHLSPHGFGVMRYIRGGENAGSVYVGNWNAGNKQGIGRWTFADGTIWFGKFVKGRREPKLADGHNYNVGDKVYGIDVSHHNTDGISYVNWHNAALYCDRDGNVENANSKDKDSKLYLQPISFAMVKASEGLDPDTAYVQHNDAIDKLLIPRGSYHILWFSEDDAKAQAKNFLKYTHNCMDDKLPPALDLEQKYVEKYDKATVSRMAREWLQEVERCTGEKPIIYTSFVVAKDYLEPDLLRDYKFWIARYGVKDPDFSNRHFWQFTERAYMHGSNHKVDIEVYNGNLDDFKREFGLR